MDKCRELEIAGVTVFQALEGFGESAEMHRSHLTVDDQPIMVAIIESEENVQRLLGEVESMMDTAMIAISDVQVIRVRNGATAT